MVREIGLALALGRPVRVDRARVREQFPRDPHHRGRALLAEQPDLVLAFRARNGAPVAVRERAKMAGVH
ncbi:MAG: hypothetical protein ACJ79W_19855 [Myxococcales bacterium]